MKPLPEAERERISANVAAVKALMPGLVPEIKALHEAGLIDGWRSVIYVGPPRAGLSGAGVVRGDQMMLESMEQTKERIGKNGTYR